MASGTTTSQQFRISDIPDTPVAAAAALLAAKQAQQQQRALRERYQRMIWRFSPTAERASEDADFAHRRYAKVMVMDSGHHLRAALSMLASGQQLTSAEVAAIVAGAEQGAVAVDDVRRLMEQPQHLPAPEIADEIRAYVRESDNPFFEPLRTRC